MEGAWNIVSGCPGRMQTPANPSTTLKYTGEKNPSSQPRNKQVGMYKDI